MKFGTRWPPVPAGILIGISMVLAFVVAGRGIGASGAMTRLVAWVQHLLAPAATEQSAYFGKYFANGAHPLNDYVVFLLVGLLIGSFVAAWLAGHLRVEVLRGPRSSIAYRLMLALGGGVISGFAARLARGCTSGQGLVGGAELSVGSWAFLICAFIGGWMTAIASIATGKIDAAVFIGGFLLGSLVFGDFFPVWGDFYNSNYMGVFRLDQWLGIGLGTTVLILIIMAVAGSLLMLTVQRLVWGPTDRQPQHFMKLQVFLIAVAVLVGIVFSFFPTMTFFGYAPEPSYYIVPR